nr:PREDICTED: complement component 1 Q subcomponent-binding protein, mitochondrial [Apteryx mantelli mantelli]
MLAGVSESALRVQNGPSYCMRRTRTPAWSWEWKPWCFAAAVSDLSSQSLAVSTTWSFVSPVDSGLRRQLADKANALSQEALITVASCAIEMPPSATAVSGNFGCVVRILVNWRITVTFNINNSIPPSLEEEEETQGEQKPDEQEPDITSTPNFVVEVIKDDTKQTLVLDCHYPEDEVGQEGEDESDIFTIREVSFQPTGESDWKETNYTLNTDSLDWALYDHLMDFLADRGVDNTFADELIELSTALEHQEYIKFLEDLKSFVKCQ